MKELIVNADDFGLSSGANRAIIRAWQEGVLTSASLMVGGSGFEEAVALARENPALQVGLHLTLVQGRAVGARAGFPPLVDSEGICRYALLFHKISQEAAFCRDRGTVNPLS
jgi:predicted glycoside hydrolase/deacetylase ChbG (UPF0249 family)